MSQSLPPVNTPLTEPLALTAGEIWNWLSNQPLYLPSQGFYLTYYFNLINDNNFMGLRDDFEIETTSADGVNFWAYLDSSSLENFVPGQWRYNGVIEGTQDGTSIRQTVTTGDMVIFPDPTVSNGDVRTMEEVIYYALEAMIANTPNLDQQEYTILDRHISKMDRAELFKFRNYYKNIVNAQKQHRLFKSGKVKATNSLKFYFGGKSNAPNSTGPWNIPQ